MEVQIITPSPPAAADFNFDSTTTSPYATAPSSPQSTIPFFWEDKPGIPKQNDTDFALGHLERHSISAADELFDGGKIKPLKPPPRMHFPNDSPKSSKSPSFRFKEVLSGFDPFSEALKQTPCEQKPPEDNLSNRGRNRTTKGNGYKVSRSLSPFRLPGVVNNPNNSKHESREGGLTWYNKWNIKNLLHFRSASEGSVSKDSLNKYTMLNKDETFSFRSTNGGGGGSVMVSAAEEMRKTTLPYKSGLLGCLRLHQTAGRVMKE